MNVTIALITGLVTALGIACLAPLAHAEPTVSPEINILLDVENKVKVFKQSAYVPTTINPKATHFVAYYSASW